ncbi:hypothetical protein P0D69_13150 [Paraburkholderia sediminicola]|uniref:hypothetical protein n=1 Tax=Paraburkholderia sediminicola TaxID=458836 RepID=UPI0038B9B5B4
MTTIAIAAAQARELRAIFAAWRREQGAEIFAEPPESAGANGAVNFTQVPVEFLPVLDAAGIQYTKILSWRGW